MGVRAGIAWRWPGSDATGDPADPSAAVIADDPAALVLLGGILLVVGVVLPRFIRRGRRRSAHAEKH